MYVWERLVCILPYVLCNFSGGIISQILYKTAYASACLLPYLSLFIIFFPFLPLKVITPAPVDAYIRSPVFFSIFAHTVTQPMHIEPQYWVQKINAAKGTVWILCHVNCLTNLLLEAFSFCFFVFWDFSCCNKHGKATASSKPQKKTMESMWRQAWLLPGKREAFIFQLSLARWLHLGMSLLHF